MKKFLALFCALGSSVAFAGKLESNTVPSSLVYAFVIADKASTDSSASVHVMLLKAKPGVGQNLDYEPLTISPDESILVSVGTAQTFFNASDTSKNKISYVPGGLYQLTFARANGEVYQSQAIMPEPTQILSPARDSVFKKSDSVKINWTAVHSDSQESDFFVEKCDHGDTSLQDISFEIPAGFDSDCAESTSEHFNITYLNLGSAFSGLHGGFQTSTSASVDFSYGGTPVHQKPYRYMDTIGVLRGFARRAHQTEEVVSHVIVR